MELLRLWTLQTNLPLDLLHTSIFASWLTTEEDFLRRSTTNGTASHFPSWISLWQHSRIPSLWCVYITTHIRYSRAWDVYHDFLSRARLLTNKLSTQGFVAARLKSSLWNSTVAIMSWCTVMKQPLQKCSQICFFRSFVLLLYRIEYGCHPGV